MPVMADRRSDGLPAEFRHELLAYEARFKALVEHLLQGHPPPSPGDQVHLTAREAQVLPLLIGGQTNRQIGAALHLRAGTIRNRLGRIYLKLGVTTRTQAAVRAVDLGLSAPAVRR
jgi:DNA-binding NarL/FixJ family response regulator